MGPAGGQALIPEARLHGLPHGGPGSGPGSRGGAGVLAEASPVEGVVESTFVPRAGYRWFGAVRVRVGGQRLWLLMTGSVAQWLGRGERVRLEAWNEPKQLGKLRVLMPGDYGLERLAEGGWVRVWPPWERVYTVEAHGRRVRFRAREAVSEDDYTEIVQLEQYHYASKEEIVAVWRCPRDGTMVEANVRPRCPKCGSPMSLVEIRGSLPSSRFMVLEMLDREEYEPRVIAYVRVDTPIPLMHRRIVEEDGSVRVERLIREKVFPPDWFHPTFWPLAGSSARKVMEKYRELAKIYGPRLARAMVGHSIARVAVARANTAAARIARVVVHPDYRGGGLGVLSVKAALDWIRERRVPEMRRVKHVVETIAAMARYNPFFERAGFYYMWDTASGRPVLMYPLTEEARRRIEEFLKSDPYARRHGGRLYRPRYKPAPPLEAPIRLVGVSKLYRNELSLEGLREDVAEVLRSFGVERRVVERYIFRDVNLEIRPGEVVVVKGASGAGKTTLLRIILGAVDPQLGAREEYRPTEGRVEAPGNARAAALLPGEVDVEFGGRSILEEITDITGDAAEAVEVLSLAGLSDAVLYRARFSELSTGQKERAKIAALLARRPNLLVIDEFTAHLDPATARLVASRLAKLARRTGMTLILVTHREEVVEAMNPDKVLVVGYGRVAVAT